jgi:hypothetical protein
MTWRCPACQTEVRHVNHETKPLPWAVYRCHICRLELRLDPTTGGLTITTREPMIRRDIGEHSAK